MVTTVTNNSTQAINTSLFSLQKEIDDLRNQINQINGKGTATPENQLADKGFVNSEISSVKSELAGKADTRHTHTKSQITDFPSSLPANGGTADRANNGTFGMLGGAKQAVSTNFEDLLNNELGSNQNGGLRGGSIYVFVGQEAKNLGIPVGVWYNFLYIPHRTGINFPESDNNAYGTLFVTPMTANNGTFYIIHRIDGYNYPAHRFDSAT